MCSAKNSFGYESGNKNYVKDKLFNNTTTERIITTSAIIVELVVLFTLLYYWKRKGKEKSKISNSVYRKNIKAIRDERINPRTIEVDRKNRKSLAKVFKSSPLHSRNLTVRAKKLMIAKGEILLAARIKQLQDQTKWKMI